MPGLPWAATLAAPLVPSRGQQTNLSLSFALGMARRYREMIRSHITQIHSPMLQIHAASEFR